jgi:hypothetical protein
MSHRREQKEALRRERMERQRAEAEASRRKRLVGYVVAGVLLAALLAAAVVLAVGGGGDDGGDATGGGDFPEGSVPDRRATTLDAALKASGCKLESLRDEGRAHTEDTVKYKTNPPTSGPHNPVPAQDGAYIEAPSKESLVHSLEHGRVVIQYRPGVPDSVIGGLKALFDEDSFHVILTPNNTTMPYEVAATAWTRLLGCRRMNDNVYDAIRALRDNFRDQAPEQVP